MKELLRGESTISLEAAVLKCPNAKLYLFTALPTHALHTYSACFTRTAMNGVTFKVLSAVTIDITVCRTEYRVL
jgi:hypothetical protein